MRTELEEFAKNFPGHTVPAELAKLLVFQNETGFETYSDGFGLYVDDKSGLRSWSAKPEFLDGLLPFAQATGGGSFYALWLDGSGRSLSETPVVVFGDEGGMHVVASNVKELMQLLTFDVEPMIDHDAVSFYRTKDYEPRPSLSKFKDWLKAELGVDPVDEADRLVAAAQAKHKAAFDAWKSAHGV